jgi:hypothetical protein
MTLLCTYHHRLLHEGGFSIAKEGDAPSGPSREGFHEARRSALRNPSRARAS